MPLGTPANAVILPSSPPCLAELAVDPNKWFSDEILPHERQLRIYVQARFPGLRDVDDLIQETYARVMRAFTRGGVTAPKALLFVTARNVAYDIFRHEQVISIQPLVESERLSVL